MTSDQPALAGLDDVRWSELQYAYGPARAMTERTPGGLVLVARLAAAFAGEQDPFTKPLQWLWENEQGPRVRAALAIALARRGDDAGYADEILCELFSDLHRDARSPD